MLFKPVPTPCVGICSTGIGDQVCRGCKRFSHEVIDWNSYSNNQRRVIAGRLEGFLAQVVANYVEIVDQKKLSTQMEHQQIRYQPHQNAFCWVVDLLKAGASQISTMEDYGIRLHARFRNEPLIEIKLAIDNDFYALSKAHYDRFFATANSVQVSLPK